jgi:hypothetical protein
MDVKLDINTGTIANLTGIGCGDPVAQNLTITATNSNPAILQDPTVTYTSPNNKASLILKPVTDATGNAIVTVIIKDDGGRANGGIDADTISFKVTILGSAISDLSDKVSLYPNPADDVVHLTLPQDLVVSELNVTNTAGQVMIEKKIIGVTQLDINVTTLPSGTYFVDIRNGVSKAQLQFVKR